MRQCSIDFVTSIVLWSLLKLRAYLEALVHLKVGHGNAMVILGLEITVLPWESGRSFDLHFPQIVFCAREECRREMEIPLDKNRGRRNAWRSIDARNEEGRQTLCPLSFDGRRRYSR